MPPRAASPAPDPDLVARLFADLLPEYGPVRSVELLAGGSVSGAWRVSSPDPAAADVVLKLVPAHDAWMARKEVHAYRLFETHGIGPIPRVLADANAVDLLGGASCLVLSVLPGRLLGEVTPGLTPAQRRDVYERLGSLIARVHAVPMPAFGFIITDVLHPSRDNVTYMRQSFDRELQKFREAGADPHVADAIAETVAARGTAFADCAAPVLCHGDFHEYNILVLEEPDGQWNVSGLIDPANLHAGDPLVDLVRTDAFSIGGDEAKRAGLLAGYGLTGEQWPAAWEPRMYLYRILLALELRNWFAERDPERAPGLDEELRVLVETRV